MPPFGSRRAFLQSSTLGASALAAGTWQSGMLYAADARSSPGPNETVNLGVIGSGGRAGQVMKRMNQVSGTRLIAVADVEDARMDRFNKTFGDGKARHYSDYRKLLEDKDVDAVLVATPGHWHVLPTIHACQAGKDVYVEKPLAHCIAEGRAAVEAAKKYNRVVQIGTQQASWEHYQRAAEIVRSGKLGPITEVKVWDMDYHYPGYGNVADSEPPAGFDWDFWLGPAPKAPYNENRHRHHYWFFDYGNGWQVDWAVHHYQIVHWFMNCDMPLSAVGVGSRYALEDNCQWPDTFSGVCEYPSCGPAPRGFLQPRGAALALQAVLRH
ncbi:MAG: Gfo/Idh/MocA family protein [Planctomycetota bacterium]